MIRWSPFQWKMSNYGITSQLSYSNTKGPILINCFYQFPSSTKHCISRSNHHQKPRAFRIKFWQQSQTFSFCCHQYMQYCDGNKITERLDHLSIQQQHNSRTTPSIYQSLSPTTWYQTRYNQSFQNTSRHPQTRCHHSISQMSSFLVYQTQNKPLNIAHK